MSYSDIGGVAGDVVWQDTAVPPRSLNHCLPGLWSQADRQGRFTSTEPNCPPIMGKRSQFGNNCCSRDKPSKRKELPLPAVGLHSATPWPTYFHFAKSTSNETTAISQKIKPPFISTYYRNCPTRVSIQGYLILHAQLTGFPECRHHVIDVVRCGQRGGDRRIYFQIPWPHFY